MKNIVKAGVVSICLASPLISVANSVGQDVYLMSNQVFMENTVDNLALDSLIKKSIPRGSKIVLRNIELDETSDKKLIALVEDQLISQLVQSGFKVLERDENAIKQAIEERFSGAKYSLFQRDIKIQPQVVDDESNKKKTEDKLLVKTHLTGADYIVSYRIQELGINYTNGDKGDISRSSNARLHVRVENAKTGEISLAKNISNSNTDTLSSDMVQTLKSYRYGQFYNGYPLSNPQENATFNYSEQRPFIELALMSAPSEFEKTIDPFSVRAYGIRSGKDRISLESITLEDDDKDLGELKNEFTMLVFGREFATIDTKYGDFDAVFQFGLGNSDMNIKDGNKIETSDGLAFKAGIGLERDLMWNLSMKVGAEVYGGEAGVLPNLYASIKYNFN